MRTTEQHTSTPPLRPVGVTLDGALSIEPRRSWITEHYSSFNGLRGIAVSLVFFCHYGPLFMPRGLSISLFCGVDIFYVLSGFLITGILYDSRHAPMYILTFYVRRALRIFPLYYGFFVLVSLVTLTHHVRCQHGMLWSHLLYLTNLAQAHPFSWNPASLSLVVHRRLWNVGIDHFWSLCVEEQFYLIWPILLWCLRDRDTILRFSGFAIAFTLLLRVALYFHHPAEVARDHYLYFITPTRCDALLIGAWLAIWLRGVSLSRLQLRRLGSWLITGSSVVLILGEATFGRHWVFNEVNPLLCTYGYTVVDLAAAGLLLLCLDDSSRISALLRNQTLSGLGKISYGFYFFHNLPLPTLSHFCSVHSTVKPLGLIVALGAFALIYLLSWLSFTYYERPFIALKDLWAPAQQGRSIWTPMQAKVATIIKKTTPLRVLPHRT